MGTQWVFCVCKWGSACSFIRNRIGEAKYKGEWLKHLVTNFKLKPESLIMNINLSVIAQVWKILLWNAHTRLYSAHYPDPKTTFSHPSPLPLPLFPISSLDMPTQVLLSWGAWEGMPPPFLLQKPRLFLAFLVENTCRNALSWLQGSPLVGLVRIFGVPGIKPRLSAWKISTRLARDGDF